jgi:hypothetical protein
MRVLFLQIYRQLIFFKTKKRPFSLWAKEGTPSQSDDHDCFDEIG